MNLSSSPFAIKTRSAATAKSIVIGVSPFAGRRILSTLVMALLFWVGSAVASATNWENGERDITIICGKFPYLASCLDAREQDWTRHIAKKRKSAYMRFGRSVGAPDLKADTYGAMEKRKSAYIRFGKRDAGELLAAPAEKQKSAYMQFGKRKSAYIRFGKRDSEATAPTEKRKSAYMRFGRK